MGVLGFFRRLHAYRRLVVPGRTFRQMHRMGRGGWPAVLADGELLERDLGRRGAVQDPPGLERMSGGRFVHGRRAQYLVRRRSRV